MLIISLRLLLIGKILWMSVCLIVGSFCCHTGFFLILGNPIWFMNLNAQLLQHIALLCAYFWANVWTMPII